MEAQGGVGRFQIVSFAIIEILFNTDSWLIYGLSYFLKYPIIKDCYRNGVYIDPESDDFNKYCIPHYFCNNPGISKQIDYDSKETLENWVHDFDLLCITEFEMSLFGMSYFIG